MVQLAYVVPSWHMVYRSSFFTQAPREGPSNDHSGANTEPAGTRAAPSKTWAYI